jgi:hypothetical protein
MDDALSLFDRGDPAAALTHLTGDDAWWPRALCAAALGDALRVAIALRRAETPAPPEVALRAAVGFASAVLSDSPHLPAWRPLGAALADGPADTDAGLAWQALVPAADLTPADSPSRARAVLLLGALAHHMGRDAEPLLRSAQELARRSDTPTVHAAASRLLAERARDAGDAELADAILAHARRVLRDAAGPIEALLNGERAW